MMAIVIGAALVVACGAFFVLIRSAKVSPESRLGKIGLEMKASYPDAENFALYYIAMWWITVIVWCFGKWSFGVRFCVFAQVIGLLLGWVPWPKLKSDKYLIGHVVGQFFGCTLYGLMMVFGCGYLSQRMGWAYMAEGVEAMMQAGTLFFSICYSVAIIPVTVAALLLRRKFQGVG